MDIKKAIVLGQIIIIVTNWKQLLNLFVTIIEI